jgi:hypothetical protein
MAFSESRVIRPELKVQRFKSPPNHEVEFGQVNVRRLRVTRKDRRVVSGIKHNAFSRVFDEGGVSQPSASRCPDRMHHKVL